MVYSQQFLPVPTSVSKKPTPPKQQAAPSIAPGTAPPATQVAGPSSDARAASKDKGKGRALPGPYIDKVPASILSFEDDPYSYSLAFNDEYAANYATVLISDTVEHVAAILMGTAPAGNFASSSREGEELAVLHPKTLPSFNSQWKPWRLPIMKAMTRRWIFWPHSIKWSHWPTKLGKTSPHLRRASPKRGGYQIGYPRHAMTIYIYLPKISTKIQ